MIKVSIKEFLIKCLLHVWNSLSLSPNFLMIYRGNNVGHYKHWAVNVEKIKSSREERIYCNLGISYATSKNHKQWYNTASKAEKCKWLVGKLSFEIEKENWRRALNTYCGILCQKQEVDYIYKLLAEVYKNFQKARRKL